MLRKLSLYQQLSCCCVTQNTNVDVLLSGARCLLCVHRAARCTSYLNVALVVLEIVPRGVELSLPLLLADELDRREVAAQTYERNLPQQSPLEEKQAYLAGTNIVITRFMFWTQKRDTRTHSRPGL